MPLQIKPVNTLDTEPELCVCIQALSSLALASGVPICFLIPENNANKPREAWSSMAELPKCCRLRPRRCLRCRFALLAQAGTPKISHTETWQNKELPQKNGIACLVCASKTPSFGGRRFDSCCKTPSDFQNPLVAVDFQAPSFSRHSRVAECVGGGDGVGTSYLINFYSWAFGCRRMSKRFMRHLKRR